MSKRSQRLKEREKGKIDLGHFYLIKENVKAWLPRLPSPKEDKVIVTTHI
jgi:hypothetical protein